MLASRRVLRATKPADGGQLNKDMYQVGSPPAASPVKKGAGRSRKADSKLTLLQTTARDLLLKPKSMPFLGSASYAAVHGPRIHLGLEQDEANPKKLFAALALLREAGLADVRKETIAEAIPAYKIAKGIRIFIQYLDMAAEIAKSDNVEEATNSYNAVLSVLGLTVDEYNKAQNNLINFKELSPFVGAKYLPVVSFPMLPALPNTATAAASDDDADDEAEDEADTAAAAAADTAATAATAAAATFTGEAEAYGGAATGRRTDTPADTPPAADAETALAWSVRANPANAEADGGAAADGVPTEFEAAAKSPATLMMPAPVVPATKRTRPPSGPPSAVSSTTASPVVSAPKAPRASMLGGLVQGLGNLLKASPAASPMVGRQSSVLPPTAATPLALPMAHTQQK